MKKTIILIILIVFALTGCSSNSAQIPVNSVSTEYLSQLNVKYSKIEAINYDEISSYKNTQPSRELTYITKNVDEVLEPFYSTDVSRNKKIAFGDFAAVKLQLFNEKDELILSDEAAKLLIGAYLFDKGIEDELVGKDVNKTYTFKASSTVKEFYNIPEVEKVIIEPQSIVRCVEGSDTKSFLDENGFNGLKEFYTYLFKMKVEEQDFEKNSSIKDAFIKYAIEKCTFDISYDDLKNYSDEVLKEQIQNAESLGIGIDEYYTNVLALNEKEFFQMCAESAEKEIKKALMIGALSQHFNIKISDEYVDEYCRKAEIDSLDEVIRTYARYLCLEELVLSKFVQLI